MTDVTNKVDEVMDEVEVIIEEEEVPLGDAPATGDDSKAGAFGFTLAAALIALGMVARKKETDEE